MIKDFLLKVWNKIKQYKAVIIMYLMPIGTYSVMLSVSIASDIFFGGFNIIKYIAYGALLAVLFIVMIVYRVCVPARKDKIKETIDKAEEKIESSIK